MTQDPLFGWIEAQQGERPWGWVLDAGTGDHSLGWIRSLKTEGWVGVTGEAWRIAALQQLGRPQDRVVVGNWEDRGFMAGEVFDTVIVDYLLGAVSGFAPFFQDQLFGRLRPHVRGRVYAVGLEPYPEVSDSEGGKLILEIARLRDACIVMAGHRCYWEYPRLWAVRQLELAGFRVVAQTALGIVYRERFIRGQLNVCRQKLPLIPDRVLAKGLGEAVDRLETRALEVVAREKGIHFGEDWVIAAEIG